jgi:16S rRNA C967 or C1407 C5-methylase (RsmB/RsmF family)/NOL1/NOP2/fmu family ribosome biogenesis protein
MSNLPEAFLQQMTTILENRLIHFIQELSTPPPTSIRKNSKKLKKWKENHDKVKWNYEKGIYLSERPSFTLDPIFHSGAYYVQEASSMFVSYAFNQFFEGKSNLKVLDLCAAPGGKSTLLADELSEDSLLLSNEVIQNRYSILRQNIQKWGYPNIHSANHNGRDFKNLEGFFDLVLIDAPCSGEGLFRKDKKAISEWSKSHVQFCAARQKRILSDVERLVKPNGYLFYCTCTYNPFENDENVKWISQEFDYEPIKLKLSKDWSISETEFGVQFFPHKIRGEGFYFSCLKKKSGNSFKNKKSKNTKFKKLTPIAKNQKEELKNWIEYPDNFSFYETPNRNIHAVLKSQIEDCLLFDSVLTKKHFGIDIGTFKGKNFIPSHSLALSTIIKKDLPNIELDKDTALHYLKKETIEVKNTELGWILARFEGHNLGWLKVLKNRSNNYYPKEWRIRMEIP